MIGVQVYCRKPSLGETDALLAIGVDHIAWDLRPDDGATLILSRLIADRVRAAGAKSAVLVHSRKIHILTTVGRMVRPTYLLLSSNRNDAEMPTLAGDLPPETSLMMSVPVRPAGSTAQLDSMQRAERYAAFAGALILDTCPDMASVQNFGCTGRTNDWDVCATVVATHTRLPVILAGGLSPDNVAAAVASVRPSAVDACTSLELPDKSKCLRACELFVRAARAGAAVGPAASAGGTA